ncbi:MAG: acyltransferase [Jannaschia sp.]
MIYLEARAIGRDNNLNLIRMLAATAVLVSHSVPISQGPGTVDPLKALIGYSLGTLSVMVFFVISGFLITASFQRSSSHTSFLLARGLRLFPGLAVNLIFVALILAPILTTLSVSEYLGRPEPYTFMLRNLALFPLVYELPGVLEEQPYPTIVGSIWTLRHEVMCYAGVFVAGLIGAWQTRNRAGLTLGLYALVWVGLALIDPPLPPIISGFVGLSLPFAIGIAFYIWRDRLPLSILGVIGTAILAWAVAGSWIYHAALSLAVGYGTFWLSYIPGGAIRAYNWLGDYSYGIYVYAFPLQGAAVWAFGSQSPLENILYSLPPTVLLSVLSWHLIEAPAMRAKPLLLPRLRKDSASTSVPR